MGMGDLATYRVEGEFCSADCPILRIIEQAILLPWEVNLVKFA